MKNRFLLAFIFIFSLSLTYSQKREVDTLTRKQRLIKDPLTASKSAFYSAVVPGLGQIYSRKYWKVPIIYTALGSSGYLYVFNDNEIQRYRTAYKRRIAGYTDDEFANRIPRLDQLMEGMEFHKRNRDLAALFFVGFYFLNILDASIGAHLLQFNTSDNLSFRPHIEPDFVNQQGNIGLTINVKL